MRHPALLSMIFRKTDTHFSGSCSDAVADANRPCNADHLKKNNSPASGRTWEVFSMRVKHFVGLLAAATIAISVAAMGAASAQDKTVKIGAIYPLSGNAAS